jgi:uncharacterized membrane protein YbhN (UPF0104 family)
VSAHLNAPPNAPSDAAPTAPSNAAGRRGRRTLFTVLKFVFAVAVLALVARVIPWRDELTYKSEGATKTYVGEIEGEWKADAIHFRFEAPLEAATLPPAWRPASGEAALASVDVKRDEFTTWRPGMPRAFKDVEPKGLTIALAMALAGICATALRWWRLLGAAGCPTGLWPATRLTFIGFFFNIVVPGLTGGDLVKAVMVARSHPERRAAAAMSVLVDRLMGVLVLVAMGAVAILWLGDRFPYPREPILIGLAVGAGGLFAYANPSLRRRIGFERLLARLPMASTLQQIDDALVVCARKPRELAWALFFSLFNQSCVMAALIALGASFGETALDVANYVVVGSIGNLVSAVPITPGGVGVAETAYGKLFELQGGSWTLGFAVAIAWRLCMVTVGLCGGLFLLTPGGRLTAAERAQLEGAAGPVK